MRRILQIGTHTTLKPTHGGKLRSHHIGKALEQAGFEVRRLAFTWRTPPDEDDPREPIVDLGRSSYWNSDAYRALGRHGQVCSEFLFAKCAIDMPVLEQEFADHVRAAEPDLIMLDHPWSWPLVSRMEVREGRIPIIYNSHNVESVLKRRVLDEEGAAAVSAEAAGLTDAIEALERSLVAHAAGVSCCTASDAEILASWGAKRVVVAPNGGVARARGHLVNLLPDPLTPSHRLALMVGSEHPPNIAGFLDFLVPALPALKPHHRIVLAGRLGLAVAQAMEARGQSELLDQRVVILGEVTDFLLDCLLANARVILLPIPYGGGSNVKTAEALLARRPIIATPAAMRGFDAWTGSPGVLIASSPRAFAEGLAAALDAPGVGATASDEALRSLQWDNCLAPLVAMADDVLRGASERARRAARGEGGA